MLKQRVLTALVLIPLVVLMLFGMGSLGYQCVMAMVVGICAQEWARLFGWKQSAQWAFMAFCMVVVVFWAVLLSPMMVLLPACAWWAVVLCLLPTYQRQGLPTFTLWQVIVLGMMVITPLWFAVILLRFHPSFGSPWYVLWGLCLTWSVDTGAYFAGRRFGKTSLASRLSPGKTLEGCLGGMMACGMVGVVFIYILGLGDNALLWFGLSMLCGVVAIAGDLFESTIKRVVKVKDSGQWLPGHGGALDRLDSLLAVMPVFALGASLLWAGA